MRTSDERENGEKKGDLGRPSLVFRLTSVRTSLLGETSTSTPGPTRQRELRHHCDDPDNLHLCRPDRGWTCAIKGA